MPTRTNLRTKEEVLEEFRCSAICDAAMTVIARKGVADTTMQDIAAEAGISKATLYVYFKDRDELLAKTAATSYERLVAELEVAFHAPGTLAERLTGVVMRQLRFFDENRELLRAAMALSPHGPGSKPRTGSYGRYMDLLEGLFTEAKARGEIRDLDPRDIAAVYADCVRGVLVRRIDSKTKTPREQQAAFIVAMLLGGIQETSS
jgi:AcrR family transcriptional regulator